MTTLTHFHFKTGEVEPIETALCAIFGGVDAIFLGTFLRTIRAEKDTGSSMQMAIQLANTCSPETIADTTTGYYRFKKGDGSCRVCIGPRSDDRFTVHVVAKDQQALINTIAALRSAHPGFTIHIDEQTVCSVEQAEEILTGSTAIV